jgi:hypothetical protein
MNRLAGLMGNKTMVVVVDQLIFDIRPNVDVLVEDQTEKVRV